jgi:hypothetical protein
MSSSTRHARHSRPRTPPERHLRLAWVFVALTPVAFVGAMFLGEGLLTAAGYDVEDTVPFDVMLRSAGPAILLMIAPAVAAVWYGLRARREGLAKGSVPALVGGVVAVAVVAANVGSYVVGRLLG